MNATHVCEICAIHVTEDLSSAAVLVKNQIPTILQSLYFPDVAPCDFWPFPSLKRLSSKVIILRLKRNVTQHNSSSQRHRGASSTDRSPGTNLYMKKGSNFRVAQVIYIFFLLRNMSESFWTLPCALHIIPLPYWFELGGERSTCAEEEQMHTELWVEKFMERDNFVN